MGEKTWIRPTDISYDHRCEETIQESRFGAKTSKMLPDPKTFSCLQIYLSVREDLKVQMSSQGKKFWRCCFGMFFFSLCKRECCYRQFRAPGQAVLEDCHFVTLHTNRLWVAGGVDVKGSGGGTGKYEPGWHEHCNKGNSASFQQENLVLSDILLIPAAMILDLSVNDSQYLGICRYK